MLALRLLRRPSGSITSRLRLLTRWQHENHGPHKEYFQHPSQYPVNGLPTTTLQVLQPTINVPPVSPPLTRSLSLIRRTTRASLLTVLFLFAGYSVGTGVITWEYLQPPYEPGSEEHQELLKDIEDLIETHPIVEELRDQGWVEESVRPNSGQGQHLVHNTLSGIQGIPVMKNFRPPTGLYSMFVFFTGFGVEGWPDVVHGGILASMFEEALEHNFKQFTDLKRTTQGETGVQFFRRVRPGEVYALLVIPKMFRPDTDGTDHFITFTTNSFLLSGDSVPDFEVAPVPESNGIQTNLDTRGDVIHAVSSATSSLKLSNLIRREDESDDAFSKRQEQEVEKFCLDLFAKISKNNTVGLVSRSGDPPDSKQ